ncbi:hypothetical protein HYC85_002351 [Camellia sinensis]|uniref:Glycoside hydrolase family 38 N-terminal domain-containing protein n=1 Tax=Camellia sinensis TaxID=4442 RepID=A0A7J7I835_CAMSI|nr:hypothetical protein HYC85_002351 [Camellia sinensis]
MTLHLSLYQARQTHCDPNHVPRTQSIRTRNGGCCMDDEVASHYIDMIDQTTLGHWFIEEKFTVTPRVGWRIDLFGHSAVQAYLLGAEVGFDSFFFGQIDYQDRDKRKNEKSHEVVWQGSKSFGSSAQVSDSLIFVAQTAQPINGSIFVALTILFGLHRKSKLIIAL